MLRGVLLPMLFSVLPALGDLSLPQLFNDGMVLQENENVCFWGKAKPFAKVRITTDWDALKYTCTANESGVWTVVIKTPTASFDSHQITIGSDSEKITYNDVLMGQVWICSGQSNMEFPLYKCESASTELPTADYPMIRHFKAKPELSETSLENISGSWQKCSPETAKSFSGVGYFFARNLYQKINQPIGLINSSWSGTPIESWMNPECLDLYPEYKTYLEKKWVDIQEKYDKQMESYNSNIEAWKKGELSRQPQKPRSPRLQDKPFACYNTMIHPIKNYTIAGVIWYQGEANTYYPDYYYAAFPLFINEWGKIWSKPKFPFYFVQLAASTGYHMRVADIREAQMLALRKMKNTGMAVTMDIGDSTDHHPKNKRDVGYRLSLWALRDLYGFKDIVCSGPLYRKKRIEENTIRVFFDYADKGLLAKGGKLTDFQICGADGQFHNATAVIDGNTVVVSCDEVSKPVDVSFAWCEYAKPNFYNKEGLPASPFNTRHMRMIDEK